MSKRRGKRVVVGYVVSHTGKRGGPWEANRAVVWGVGTYDITFAKRWTRKDLAEEAASFVRGCMSPKPHARALPLVRYEVDAEEERLRDAVVEAAVIAHEALELVRDIAARQQRLADIGKYSDAISAEHDVAGPAYHEKHVALFAAVRALRAHREKVGR